MYIPKNYNIHEKREVAFKKALEKINEQLKNK